MILEVQALTGRTGDTVLVDPTRITRWLNEAQDRIADTCPGLADLEYDDSTSLVTVEGQLIYALADITCTDPTTENQVCHLAEVYYIDGNDSAKLDFKPVDEFDEKWPCPTSPGYDKPHSWTLRSNKIELFPIPSSGYASKTLRVNLTRYPKDFSVITDNTDLCQIEHVDEGLINYATAQAWGAIGVEEKRILWQTKWNEWLADYKVKSEAMLAWEEDNPFDLP